MRVYSFGDGAGGQMRFTGRLAIAVAGLLAVAGLIAPAAGAQVRAQARAQALAAPTGIAARSAELANAASGAVLWSKDVDRKRPMGSVTKVMTAYVVLRTGDLNRVITVPSGIIGYDNEFGASTAGLVPGEKLTALQLLYALMLPSGCDAAYALATSYGGRTKFIATMNTTARRLGLGRMHFTDFSGLPTPTGTSTYSSAADLIALGRDAMKLSLFRQIVATRSYHLASGNGHRAHTWTNKNSLLWQYPGAIGIKTGQTSDAGACLLFEARRGSRTLIGVVLHSSSFSLDGAFKDATKMLNWGFARA